MMDQLKRRRSLEMDLRRRPSVASAGDLRKVTRSIFKRLDLSEEVRLEVSCSHSKQSIVLLPPLLLDCGVRLCLKLDNCFLIIEW